MNSPGVISKAATKRAVNRSAPLGVLVLGMHRSGTSALTRTLNLLGCALPEALVGASEGNELGHWESASAVILNDEILASAGSNWNDWGPINSDWRASGVRGQMVERATEVIREHKALGPLFALKDPRLCRLADLWLEAGDAVGVDMRVVLMLRHPGEVSASLESRDLMAPGYGQLLWLRHTLDAEHLSRGRKRVVCRFDRLLVDWQDTIDRVRQGLDLALPRNSPAAHAEVEQFLARDMRHHDAREDAGLGLLGAFDWLRRTFGIMQHWADQGEEAADHAELDRIRTEFDNAYPAFSRLLLSSGYSGEFATGSRLRDQLQHQLVEVSERAQAIAQQATEVESLRAAATRVSGLEVEIARLVAREAELARWIDTQDSKIAAAVEASESERKLRNEIEQELTTREAELAQEKLGNAELTGRILAAESAAVQRQEELAQLWSQLEALQQAAGAATAEIAAERARRTEAEAQLAEEARNLRNLAAEKSELEASIRAAEAAALERQQEVAQLWNQLGTVQQAAGAATAEGAVERERRVDAEARLAEAMQDLRGLGSEKGELEIRVRIAEMALASQRDEQLRAAEQLAEAKAATEAAATQGEWERKFRLEREGQLTEAQSELADLRAQLESLQQAPVPTAVFDELAQLTRLLQASETEAAAAAAARAAAERRVAEQTEELIRLSALLSQENGRAEGSAGYAEWLREMSRVVEAMPKWWGMMPESWRRKREHEAYRRTGLFDAQLYLQNYPDVAADGMDPVRHYIQHGMAEGRQMWR
jgi:hypothetical protein